MKSFVSYLFSWGCVDDLIQAGVSYFPPLLAIAVFFWFIPAFLLKPLRYEIVDAHSFLNDVGVMMLIMAYAWFTSVITRTLFRWRRRASKGHDFLNYQIQV